MRKFHLLLLFGAALTFSLGATAAATETPDLQLEAQRGKVVYLDFWASWCAPCKLSFPWMAELEKKFGDQGLVVRTVNVDSDSHAAERFLKRFEFELPVVFDPEGALAGQFDLETMPSSFIIGRDGSIRYRHAGFRTEDVQTLEAELSKALAEQVDDAKSD